MISFFRRALSSWIVLGLLGLIMIAFIVTGVGTPGGLGNLSGGGQGDRIATIGREKISASELTERARQAVQNMQQQQQGLTMAAFASGGGVEDVANQIISARAIEIWGREAGFDASKRLVDGEIASISAFHGPTGQFDESVFRGILTQRRLSEAQVRADIAGDAIRRQIIAPISAGVAAPKGVVTPYAALLLERRSGFVGLVPSALMPAGAAPDEAAITKWYQANLARYTLPERRVIRYALFGKDQLPAVSKPTEAEIAAFYKANSAEYGAVETRSFSQVVLPDQGAANAFAAKVKGGISFADAARQAGFAPSDTALGEQSPAQLAGIASKAIADAAFAAPEGAITQPLKSALGWHVLHVDAVTTRTSRPLAAVHEEIATALAKQKVDEAIADLVSKIEDEIGDGASLDETAKAHKLTVVTTPALLASGRSPDNPAYAPPPELQVLLKTAFEASTEDDPTVETIGNGTIHALLKVNAIEPSAPIPLAKIRDGIIQDLLTDRAFQRAHAVGKSIVAKADGGIDLAKAIAEAGLNLPSPQAADARQIDIMQSQRPAPPPLALMFSMKPGTTKLLEAPDKKGWYIVHLAKIAPGDVASAPGLVEATRGEFRSMIAQELVAQFARSVEKTVGVERFPAAIAKTKAQLVGSGSQ